MFLQSTCFYRVHELVNLSIAADLFEKIVHEHYIGPIPQALFVAQQGIQYNRKRIMALKNVDPANMKTMKRAVNDVRMSCGDCHYFFKGGR